MWSFCENWWRVFSSQIQKMINRVIYWRDEKMFPNLALVTKLCTWTMFQFSVEKHSKTFCYLFPKQEIWASFYLAIAAELWDFQRLSQSFWILFLLLSGLVCFLLWQSKKKSTKVQGGLALEKRGTFFSKTWHLKNRNCVVLNLLFIEKCFNTTSGFTESLIASNFQISFTM